MSPAASQPSAAGAEGRARREAPCTAHLCLWGANRLLCGRRSDWADCWDGCQHESDDGGDDGGDDHDLWKTESLPRDPQKESFHV